MKSDIYTKILEILPGERPPNYYVLLHISLFESDGKIIHQAGLQQIKKLREWQLHPDPEVAAQIQNLLNEVSFACTTLEVAEKKKKYDENLSVKLGIDLNASENYQVLSTESELIRCPNCNAEMSAMAILCIECGYNLETGQIIETKFETQESSLKIKSEFESRDDASSYDYATVKEPGAIFKLFIVLPCTILKFPFRHKKLFILSLIILTPIVYYLSWNYELEFDEKHKLNSLFDQRWRFYPMIKKSTFWQMYFKYPGRSYVRFKIKWGVPQDPPTDLTIIINSKEYFSDFVQERTEDSLTDLVNKAAKNVLLKLMQEDPVLCNYVLRILKKCYKNEFAEQKSLEIISLLKRYGSADRKILNLLTEIISSPAAPLTVKNAAEDTHLTLLLVNTQWKFSYDKRKTLLILHPDGILKTTDSNNNGTWSIKNKILQLESCGFQGHSKGAISSENKVIIGSGTFLKNIRVKIRWRYKTRKSRVSTSWRMERKN